MRLLSIYCVPVTFQAHHVGKLIDGDDYLHFPDGKGETPGGQETCFRSQLLGRGGVGICSQAPGSALDIGDTEGTHLCPPGDVIVMSL